jgi:hypothetical protein
MAKVLALGGQGWDMPDDQAKLRADADESRRQRESARAWAYYDGYMPPQLKVKPGDHDDNVRYRYPTVVVDSTVSFLFGQDVAFSTEDEAAQDVVDIAWGPDEVRMTTLQRLGINGAVCGHAFVKLGRNPAGAPRVIILDPSNVTVDWAPDDFTKVIGYHIEWTAYDPRANKAISYRQDIQLTDVEEEGPWLIEDFRRVGTSGWVQTNEEVWDLPFAPIVDCQNMPTANEYWGRADLTSDVLDLADAINMAATNIQKILRYHASPKVFVYGYSGKALDMATDVVINFPSTDIRVDTLGMPTDLNAAFNQLNDLKDEFLRATATPRAALGDPTAAWAASSGIALKLGFGPLVAKTAVKRQTYGTLMTEVNSRIQAMDGKEPVDVSIEWPSITPSDPMGDAQTALLQQQLGVSKDTLLASLGFDPDQEAEKKQEEDAASVELMQQQMAAGAFGGAPAPSNDTGGTKQDNRNLRGQEGTSGKAQDLRQGQER